MIFTVDKNNKINLQQQIVNQIIELINNGTLAEGTRMPSTRELANTLGVNRTTVVHAYEELWVQGYVESSPGAYTTVRKRQPTIAKISSNKEKEEWLTENVFAESLGLKYDHMMYYLENWKEIETGKINFLRLSPDTRLLDEKQVKACMRESIYKTTDNPFDFAPARGYEPLRCEIVKHMKLHGLDTDDKNVLVTNGSLQSLQLIFQVFSQPGDYIVVESPTYSIILLLAQIFKLHVVQIPMTAEGMDLNLLEKELITKPVRFIYTMPTYQNPTGISMPQRQREKLLQICENKHCIVIEDSIEEEIKYSGKAYLPIKSIDRNGQVIYLGTFTKILAPGLRMGWIIASAECIKKLTVLKSIFEISSGSINQIFLYNFFHKGAFELHLRKTVKIFQQRMKIAANAIRKHVPAEKIEWTEPNGGYMIWIKLLTKPKVCIENVFSHHGVLVHNGQYFFAEPQAFNYIRVCIAYTNEVEIEEGIMRIGEAIKTLE